MDWKYLSEDNFVIYAIKNYDNPQCKDRQEFEEDLNRIVYIKKLLRRYANDGDLKERLILNHLITFYNVFGIEAATHMLLFKLEEELYSHLKTFLVYLNYISNDPTKKYKIDFNLIMIDEKIAAKLRKL